MNRLRDEMYGYSRGKLVTFGNIQFLSAAREGLLRSSTDAMQQSAETSDLWAQKLALNDAQWRDKLREKEKEYHVLAEQLDRQKQYQERLEKEKEKLREDNTKERHRTERLLADTEGQIRSMNLYRR